VLNNIIVVFVLLLHYILIGNFQVLCLYTNTPYHAALLFTIPPSLVLNFYCW